MVGCNVVASKYLAIRGVASIWLSGPFVSAKVGWVGPTVYCKFVHTITWPDKLSCYIKFTTKIVQNTKDKFEYLLV